MNPPKPQEIDYQYHLYEIARHLRRKKEADRFWTLEALLEKVKREIEFYEEELGIGEIEGFSFKPGDRVQRTNNGRTGWIASIPYMQDMDPQFASLIVHIFYDDTDYDASSYPDTARCDDLTEIDIPSGKEPL